ncbi:all0469 [Nostoc sp. PCC 7120 = FACHB-418]|nr:all0469 [Nostoc sp. PCC 7120 = FACHB-418]
MLRIALDGRDVGAYILTKGTQKDKFCFVFGFECKGIHTTLRKEQIDTIFNNIESGLKDIPEGERMTLHMGSFSSDQQRQIELTDLIRRTPSRDIKYLLMAERARAQELTAAGIRKPKFLKIYVTYTIEPSSTNANDWIEKLLGKAEGWWLKFKGDIAEVENQRIESVIAKAYQQGFCRWEQLLSNKMGLDIKPLNAVELWENVWRRFNDTQPIEIPQLVTLDENGLYEQAHSDLSSTQLLIENVHSTTLLMESGVPCADRRWVNVNNNYIGAMTFLEKPGGWPNKFAQLRYLWELLARESIVDTEIVCQLTAANPALVKTTLQRVLKQSNMTAMLAQEKSKTIDVNAQLKLRKSVAAQEQLFEGAVPIYTGLAIFVHRPTVEKLDEATRYIENCFQRPARVVRETEYAWKIWLQSLPIVWEGLLVKPFNRRQLYLTSEVPGLMPLVITKAGDKHGFELIAEEGGTPVQLDLFNQHKNLALFATTRAGKSVLVSGILTQALAHGIPVVALDFPKPDGTSTFTDYAHFMEGNGAYFDISRQSNNLFEQPDLRSLDPEQQRDRLLDYTGFLESALMTMVLGSSNDNQLLTQTVRSLLNLALSAFFADQGIQERYKMAIAGGFGTPAWQKTPTLHDFLHFCSPEHLQLDSVSGRVEDALSQIHLRLRFWLSSRVGQAISAPSSFPTDAQLLVFALRNLSDNEDAAVLSLSAYSAALRRALSSPASIFFIDEAPILFEFDQISDLVGRMCANGAKAGIRVILSAQDPDTIAKSKASSKILQNLTTRLIGRIQPVAVDSFVSILKYPREIIARNASESFFPRKEGVYSQWLLDDNGIHTFCRYYPGYEQLAVVANNPNEQTARQQAMQDYRNKYEAISVFARQLVASLRSS